MQRRQWGMAARARPHQRWAGLRRLGSLLLLHQASPCSPVLTHAFRYRSTLRRCQPFGPFAPLDRGLLQFHRPGHTRLPGRPVRVGRRCHLAGCGPLRWYRRRHLDAEHQRMRFELRCCANSGTIGQHSRWREVNNSGLRPLRPPGHGRCGVRRRGFPEDPNEKATVCVAAAFDKGAQAHSQGRSRLPRCSRSRSAANKGSSAHEPRKGDACTS